MLARLFSRWQSRLLRRGFDCWSQYTVDLKACGQQAEALRKENEEATLVALLRAWKWITNTLSQQRERAMEISAERDELLESMVIKVWWQVVLEQKRLRKADALLPLRTIYLGFQRWIHYMDNVRNANFSAARMHRRVIWGCLRRSVQRWHLFCYQRQLLSQSRQKKIEQTRGSRLKRVLQAWDEVAKNSAYKSEQLKFAVQHMTWWCKSRAFIRWQHHITSYRIAQVLFERKQMELLSYVLNGWRIYAQAVGDFPASTRDRQLGLGIDSEDEYLQHVLRLWWVVTHSIKLKEGRVIGAAA